MPTEHDEVWGVSVHVLCVKRAIEQLGITSTAIDVLFVLHGELKNQRLVLVGEGLELS
jgi:hypothetical protein